MFFESSDRDHVAFFHIHGVLAVEGHEDVPGATGEENLNLGAIRNNERALRQAMGADRGQDRRGNCGSIIGPPAASE